MSTKSKERNDKAQSEKTIVLIIERAYCKHADKTMQTVLIDSREKGEPKSGVKLGKKKEKDR